MSLHREMVRAGHRLFRWRGYLPAVLLALVLTQMRPLPGPAGEVPLTWPLLCFGVSLVGLAIRAYTVGHAAPGTSGRNRHGQVAAELNTTGAYSVVRHPLYLGNAVTWLGPALVPRIWWLVVLVGLICWLHYERIMLAEEEFLRAEFGRAYLDWAERTPAFLPAFRNWRPPSAPFNVRVVLRREYSGVFQLVLAFAILNARQWQLATGRWTLSPVWAGLLIAGTVIAGSLRILRKRTHLLEDRAAAPDPDESELPETKWPVRQSRTGQDVVAGDAGVPSRPT
jgi:protein-S-isoprenylcysteine O-methyltransferase Ste14